MKVCNTNFLQSDHGKDTFADVIEMAEMSSGLV